MEEKNHWRVQRLTGTSYIAHMIRGALTFSSETMALDKRERSTARSWTSSHHLSLAFAFGMGFQASYLDVKRPNKGGVWNLDLKP